MGGERGEGFLRFADPEGLEHELAVVETSDPPLVADHPEIPRSSRSRASTAFAHSRPIRRRVAPPRGDARVRAGRRLDLAGAARNGRSLRVRPGAGGARRDGSRRRPTSRGPLPWTTTSSGSSASRPPGCARRRSSTTSGSLHLLPRAERRVVRDRDAGPGLRRRRIPSASAKPWCP